MTSALDAARRIIDLTVGEVRDLIRDELSRYKPEPESDWMTLDQAAKLMGVCTKTVATRAKKGLLPHRKLGDRLRFSRRELEGALKA